MACSSREILQHPDAYIELLENYPCADKNELNRREGHFIRTMLCVNKRIAGRTLAEYLDEHKDEKQQYNTQYRIDNNETIKEQQKQYRQNNKEHRNGQMKQWYQNNKETIKAKQNQKHKCCCGGNYTHGNKQRHFKTAHHVEFVHRFYNRLQALA